MMQDYSFTRHRIFQWMGILLALGIIAVGYWYYQSQASTLNKSPTGSLTSGLVGYWTFDGADTSTTTATDRSGNSNTGTLTNGPTTTEGKVGQALSFDGVNDYVAVASSPSLTFGSSPHTVSFWFKVNTAFNSSSATSVPLITRRDSDDVNFSCTLRGTDYANGSGGAGTMQIKYESQNGVAAVYWHTTQTSWAANVWYHVVIIINTDGTNSNVYINGVAAKGGSSGGTTIYDTNYTAEWRLGRGDFDTASNLSGVKYLSGSLDEARIYNAALTATQIQSLYSLGQSDKANSSVSQPQGTGRLDSGLAGYWALDNGSGTSATDSSTNSNTGTLTNGPTWTTGQIGGAISFDGTDDYLYVSSAAPLAIGVGSKVSTSFWYTANVSNGTTQTIYQRASGTCSQYIANITGGASTDTLIFYYRDTGCGGIDTYSVSSITKNTWHHVVSTYDTITGVLSVYVDGVRVATTTSVPSSSISDGVTLTIGAGQGGTNFFGGTLDEFRFYSRVLSPDEVAQLYRLTAPTGVDTGLKGYWSFNAQDMSSTTAYDRSGAGNTGTLTNGPTITEGKLGQALDLDGTDDYVSIADNAALDIGDTEDLTLTGWFYRDTFTTDDTIVAKRNGIANTDDGYIAYIDDSTDKLTFEVSENSGTDEYQIESPATFTSVGWNHFAIVWDQDSATNSEIYINGTASLATDTGTIGNLGDLGNSVVLAIGAESDAGNPFDGKLDETRMYKRALSAAEIKALYDAGESDKVNSSVSQSQGTGRLDSGLAGYWQLDDGSGTSATDSSTNGNTGTLTGAGGLPTWGTGQIGGDVVFDGADDFINIPDSTALRPAGAITLSAWIKPNGTPVSDARIMAKGNTTTRDYGYGYQVGSGKLAFFHYGGGLQIWETTTAWTSIFTSDVWAHVTVTYTSGVGSSLRMYVNGVSQAGSWTTGTGNGALTFSSDPLRIGASYFSGLAEFFNGSIDEIRIYNRSLSADEVAQLYRLATPTGVDTSLKGYWSFNGKDMSGTSAFDRSGAGNTGTLTNGPAITEGKSGQALSFDGSDDYVSVNNSFGYANTTFTACAWIKTTSASNEVIVSQQNNVAGTYGGWNLGVNNNTTNKFGIILKESSGNNPYTVASNTSVNDGQWHHTCAVITTSTTVSANNTALLYVDGVNDQASPVLDGSRVYTATTDSLRIGSRVGSSGSPVQLFAGSIDEVRIYNRALGASEIAALYNAGR